MSGDHGFSVVLAAAQSALERHNDIELILVGDTHQLEPALAKLGSTPSERLHLHHASQQVTMADSPIQSLRKKKHSSMRIALDLVKSNEVHACVSAGNTGALVLMSRSVIKTLPGLERTAIISPIPTFKGHTYVLDLGANIGVSAHHLFQFAVMGSILVSAVEGIEAPTIGLLNIGEENIKGDESVRGAARLLSDSPLNYVGYIENIYAGTVDIVVCDGFLGNVALKTSEGLAHMLRSMIRQEFSRSVLARLMAYCAYPVMKPLLLRIDPRRYNGASLLGLRGIVVKSHGSADAVAFSHAIDVAITEVSKNIPQLISEKLSCGDLYKAASMAKSNVHGNLEKS